MRKRAKAVVDRDGGFTLVELLIVMLILGILAAIALPAFFSQQDKAHDGDAKAMARTAQTAAEVINTENDGAYDGVDGVTVANLQAVELNLNNAVFTVPAVAADTYTVRVTSDSGNTFDVTRNADGTTAHTCATASDGGCPAGGVWG